MEKKIKKCQKELLSDKPVLDFEDDTIRYMQKPIGKAIYRGRPKMTEEERGKPSDRITCEICGQEFVRSNRSHHNKNQRHQLYSKVNKKMAKLVLDDD